MRNPTRATVLRGAALGALGLFAAGCSRHDSATGDAGDRSLTFQASWINDAEFTGYFVAIDEGYYAEEGLQLEYVSGGPSVIPESSLLSGAAHIALTSPDTTVSAITEQGAELVVVGTQYQRNPLGVVSLAASGIATPADLVGRTVAVPDVNRLAFEAMLTVNDIALDGVSVVPYAYDPTPLLNGEVDATLDFVTNVPFTLEQAGAAASSFLLYDAGYRIPNDTVVVTRELLEDRREDVVAWLRASRRGWEANLADPALYPPQFMDTWFEGTGRTLENELFFNQAQKPLVEDQAGIFALTPESIAATIESLALVGLTATEDMFDGSLLEDL
ncbi:ABC transporter substrate-binding protein [Kineococcus sp. SYSU DK003]|uniref:ABC transporter substrate-binding protein n=1 Tax=Kineococcus sp. SYSU DK003 TaxID=3383124 RepID=UPI003D7C7E63